MCIIIHKPKNIRISKDVAANSVRINGDGFGILYLDSMKVVRTMDMEHAKKLLRTKRPYVAHCRWATNGPVCLENTHPFPLKDGSWLFHNGVVGSLQDSQENDSRQVAFMLDMLPRGKWETFLSMFDSRFLIAKPDGEIIKTGGWVDHEGACYSKANVLTKQYGRYSTSGGCGTRYGNVMDYGDDWTWRDYDAARRARGVNTTAKKNPAQKSDNIAGKLKKKVCAATDKYVVDGASLIAVYGTLKRGLGNHRCLAGATLVGTGVTFSRHRLCVQGLPYLIQGANDRNQGRRVDVEVYSVPDKVLEDVDALEGHPHLYCRKSCCVTLDDTKETIFTQAYFASESRDSGRYALRYPIGGDSVMVCSKNGGVVFESSIAPAKLSDEKKKTLDDVSMPDDWSVILASVDEAALADGWKGWEEWHAYDSDTFLEYVDEQGHSSICFEAEAYRNGSIEAPTQPERDLRLWQITEFIADREGAAMGWGDWRGWFDNGVTEALDVLSFTNANTERLRKQYEIEAVFLSRDEQPDTDAISDEAIQAAIAKDLADHPELGEEYGDDEYVCVNGVWQRGLDV